MVVRMHTRAHLALFVLVTIMTAPAAGQAVSSETSDDNLYVGGKPTLPPDDPEDLIRYVGKQIDKAREHLRDGELRQARIALDSIDGQPATEAQLKEVAAIIRQLAAAGRQWMERGQELYEDGKYAEALRTFRRVNVTFATLDCGRKARAALRYAEKDPACQDALRELRAEDVEERLTRILTAARRHRQRKAETAIAPSSTEDAPPPKTPAVTARIRPANEVPPEETEATSRNTGPDEDGDRRVEAIRAMTPERQLAALDVLRDLVEHFPQTQAGKRARRDLDQLDKDAVFEAGLKAFRRDQTIRQRYAKAMMYYNAGMTDEAQQHLRDFIEAHPDAPQASRARETLRKIRQATDTPGDRKATRR
jgi:tetratricopeptide (TPR) repeat protein